MRDQLGLQNVNLLLFVGRLAVNKRVPVLVEALHRLRDRRPAVHLVLVGDVTDVYQIEAQRCKQRAAELGIADREIKRVKNARFVEIPISDETRGHGTTGMARFYAQPLAELLQRAPPAVR